MSGALVTSFNITLPDWCRDMISRLPAQLNSDREKMQLAIELSRQNVEQGTGGPFAAVVTSVSDGSIIAIGVNRVESDACSSAHGEIVALSLAQARLRNWNLSEAPTAPLELITSCEPCAMCLGAIPWSGVARVVCGASKNDAEITGFDEGERSPDWIGMLNRRGIEVLTHVLQAEAAQVLIDYSDSGARIYNP